MGILRSNTTLNISSHFHHHKPSSTSQSQSRETQQTPPTSDPTPGINRSVTDPVTPNKTINNPLAHTPSTSNASSIHKTTPPTSRPTSGTSSPHRKHSSMDIVRNIRDRPTSAIPGYHVLAEQLHKYKMRNCHGMSATEEEMAGIDRMKKWNWKHAGHPGEAKFPVGPMDEEWKLEGVALEQLHPKLKRHKTD